MSHRGEEGTSQRNYTTSIICFEFIFHPYSHCFIEYLCKNKFKKENEKKNRLKKKSNQNFRFLKKLAKARAGYNFLVGTTTKIIFI